jgi:hypothetical protein
MRTSSPSCAPAQKQLIKVTSTKMIFSIECACAETADQGVINEDDLLHRVRLRRKQLIKVSKTKMK